MNRDRDAFLEVDAIDEFPPRFCGSPMNQPQSFEESYKSIFASAGVRLFEEHRSSSAEIDEAEKRLQLIVPQSLRDFYLVAGRETRINQFYNRLIPPDKWTVDAGRLVFLEENRSIVYWGVPVKRSPEVDAPVFQGVNRGPEGIVWHEEHDHCSEFLKVMAVWHATYGGAAPCCAVGYVDENPCRSQLDETCTFVGEVNQLRAYCHPHGVLSFLKWEDRFQQRLKLKPWRVHAAAATVEYLALIKDSINAQWEDWGG